MSTYPKITLSEVLARKDALQAELSQLEEAETYLKEERETHRNYLLAALVNKAITRLSSKGLNVVRIMEGHELTKEVVIDSTPFPGNNEVAVQAYSVRERKGYVDHADQPDYRNPSYRNDELVVVQFAFPREDFAEILDEMSEEES